MAWDEIAKALEPYEPEFWVVVDIYSGLYSHDNAQPNPADRLESDVQEMASDVESDIGVPAQVDQHRVIDLDDGAVGSYQQPVNLYSSADTISVDRQFAQNASEDELYEVLVHETMHAYQSNYDRPTGDLMAGETDLQVPEPVAEEMNYADKLYEVASSEWADEETRQAAERGLEARTQWFTEAIAGERTGAYNNLVQEMDVYMEQKYGIGKEHVDGLENSEAELTPQYASEPRQAYAAS